MFWIGFTKQPLLDAEPNEEGLVGLLMLGNYEERFVSHTCAWSERDYAEQWRCALATALDGKPSALITDMRTQAQSSHLVWWPMWKVGSDVVLHNQLLFFAKHKVKGAYIEIERLYELIGEHTSTNSDGTPVSEWRVPLDDIKEFLRSNSTDRGLAPGSRSKRLN
jgi:hypothetical protein